MKPAVAAMLGAGVFSVLLGAYLVSYVTTVHDPVEWKTGDVIVQNANVEQTLPVFAADGSGMTHIGIVEARPEGAVVIEAADKVRETPVRAFIAQGKAGAFAVYRIPALSEKQGEAVVQAAKRQLGKPNDFFLRRSWDALYSSELVRLAYGDIGLDLGRTQKLSSVAKGAGPVRSQFTRSWSNEPDCVKRNLDATACWTMISKQEVITPAAIVGDSQMTQVYSNLSPPPEPAKAYGLRAE